MQPISGGDFGVFDRIQFSLLSGCVVSIAACEGVMAGLFNAFMHQGDASVRRR
ncbi:MAG: hypothetical protein RIR97_1598, partial [Pseudomonadota bacterium]